MRIQILAPPATSWVHLNISVYYSHYKIITSTHFLFTSQGKGQVSKVIEKIILSL